MQRLEAPPPAEQLDRRSRSPQCFRLRCCCCRRRRRRNCCGCRVATSKIKKSKRLIPVIGLQPATSKSFFLQFGVGNLLGAASGQPHLPSQPLSAIFKHIAHLDPYGKHYRAMGN